MQQEMVPIMEKSKFRVFPSDRMSFKFPWQIWAVGWLCIFKGIIWLASEPNMPESLLSFFGAKYLLGMLPLWLWEPGEVVRDVRELGPVPAGEYTVRLGMWELATGKHWPAAGHPDSTVHLTVRCP